MNEEQLNKIKGLMRYLNDSLGSDSPVQAMVTLRDGQTDEPLGRIEMGENVGDEYEFLVQR